MRMCSTMRMTDCNCPMWLPGVKSIAPFRNAYSLTLMLSRLHLTRNILIPSASPTGTPGSRVSAGVRCCRSLLCVKMRCNRLGCCVSTVSKSTESCTMPRTSSGAQLLRTSRSWSSGGKPRKHGTFFTNLKVFTSTSEVALKTNLGARISTSFLLHAHEQSCCAVAVSRCPRGHCAPLLRML